MLLVLKIAQKWLFPDDKDKKVTPAKGKRKTLTKESNDTGQHSNSTHKDIQIGLFMAEQMRKCIDEIHHYENRKTTLGLA